MSSRMWQGFFLLPPLPLTYSYTDAKSPQTTTDGIAFLLHSFMQSRFFD